MKKPVYRLELNVDRQPVIVKEKTVEAAGQYNSPEALAKLAISDPFRLDRIPHEEILLVGMNNNGNIVGTAIISRGTSDSAVLSPREVFIHLLLMNANHFALIHNHPSGSVEPSEEDIKLTRGITEAGKVLCVPLVDHIIIADGCYCSMYKKGLL